MSGSLSPEDRREVRKREEEAVAARREAERAADRAKQEARHAARMRDLPFIERYAAAAERVKRCVREMHYGKWPDTDLEAFERAAELLERVVAGERISIKPSQALSAETRSKGSAPEPLSTVPDGRQTDLEEAIAAADGDGRVSGRISTDEAIKGALADRAEGRAMRLAKPETVVVGNKPPIAKPGRGRGFRAKPE